MARARHLFAWASEQRRVWPRDSSSKTRCWRQFVTDSRRMAARERVGEAERATSASSMSKDWWRRWAMKTPAQRLSARARPMRRAAAATREASSELRASAEKHARRRERMARGRKKPTRSIRSMAAAVASCQSLRHSKQSAARTRLVSAAARSASEGCGGGLLCSRFLRTVALRHLVNSSRTDEVALRQFFLVVFASPSMLTCVLPRAEGWRVVLRRRAPKPVSKSAVLGRGKSRGNCCAPPPRSPHAHCVVLCARPIAAIAACWWKLAMREPQQQHRQVGSRRGASQPERVHRLT